MPHTFFLSKIKGKGKVFLFLAECAIVTEIAGDEEWLVKGQILHTA